MNKIMIPVLIYVILAAAYLLVSGAPLRVHFLSLVILFLVVPVSPWLCSMARSSSRRFASSFLCATVSLLIWDSTQQLVIVKAEFLEILRYRPWVYPVVAAILGTFIYAVPYLSTPLNHRLQRIADKPGSR